MHTCLDLTYSKETKERVSIACQKARNTLFPIHIEVENIIGIYNVQTLSLTHFVSEKGISRTQEQSKILAKIGITDNASAIAYLNKLELQLELWAKIKADFDSETEARLKELQLHFLEKNR